MKHPPTIKFDAQGWPYEVPCECDGCQTRRFAVAWGILIVVAAVAFAAIGVAVWR